MVSHHWAPFEPDAKSPWTLRRVVHLHRRAGFAATWEELQRDLRDGPIVSVDRLLAGTACTVGGTSAGRLSSYNPTALPTKYGFGSDADSVLLFHHRLLFGTDPAPGDAKSVTSLLSSPRAQLA
jgi:hypothetical protein